MAEVVNLYGPRPTPEMLAPAAPLHAGAENPLIARVIEAHEHWAFALAAGNKERARNNQLVLVQAIAFARADAATNAEFGAQINAIATQIIEVAGSIV